MKLFKKKENGIKLINNGKITNLYINGIDISQYVLSYKIKQDGGNPPKLTIEIMPNRLEIITKELKDMSIKVYNYPNKRKED